jgi:hypothetical protein
MMLNPFWRTLILSFDVNPAKTQEIQTVFMLQSKSTDGAFS